MRVNSWLAEKQLASHEGLCSVEQVIPSILLNVSQEMHLFRKINTETYFILNLYVQFGTSTARIRTVWVLSSLMCVTVMFKQRSGELSARNCKRWLKELQEASRPERHAQLPLSCVTLHIPQWRDSSATRSVSSPFNRWTFCFEYVCDGAFCCVWITWIGDVWESKCCEGSLGLRKSK